jgi:hypothetical protein
MIVRTVAFAGLTLGLAGCLGAGEFADRAVEHNRAIAEAADEVMLLNIVRAKYDRPIVYSQFSGVSENFSNNFGIGTSIPFGGDAGDFYNIDIATGPEQFTSLSTKPLDDKDFYQGVMRPIQVSLIRYYLDNGWPRDLVMALTVEKLDIGEAFYRRVVAESDAICAATPGSFACQRIASRAIAPPSAGDGRIVFYNDPRRADLFDPFHDLALRLIVLGLSIESVNAAQTLRVPESAMIGLSADEIAKLTAMSASVKREGGDLIVTTYAWRPALRLTQLSDTRVRVEGQAGTAAEVDMTASLRSPDSILFYLGAYTRGGADAQVLIDSPGSERWVSVFDLEGCEDAAVEVEFDGACYGIPRTGDHVSMKVVGFLHQVFALNKSAVEPPSTGVVQTVR